MASVVSFSVGSGPALAIAVVSPLVDSTIQRNDPLVIDVTSPELLTSVVIIVSYPDTGAVDVAYDSTRFRGYYANSARDPLTTGFRFTLKFAGGWRSRPVVEVVAADAFPRSLTRSFSWFLAASATVVASSAADLLANLPASSELGILTPFQRDAKLDFATGGDVLLVKSAIYQILGTEAASDSGSGELPWQDDFGSLLHRLRHAPLDEATDAEAMQYVIQALARWDRRIVVTNAEVFESSGPDGTPALAIRIGFDLLATPSSGRVVAADQQLEVPITR